jgi:halocyanin-like protein
MTTPDSDRRRLLQASGVAATAALAGCLGFFQNDIDFDEEVPEEVQDHLSNANNVDGSITDRTGESELAITVAPNGNLSFDPALVRVDVGTTVTWEWDASGHTVTSVDGAEYDSGRQGGGATFTHTFETADNHLYKCKPHEGAGHLGAIIAVEPSDQTE